MKKRFLTLALILLSAVGAWAYDFKVDGICYSFSRYSDNEVYVTYDHYPNNGGNPAYTSLSGDITIPSSVSYNGQDYSVTSIGEQAFSSCNAFTSITIPNSVTSIEGHAFYGCSALTSITIPNSVTSIGEDAFKNCYTLTDIYFTGSVADWCQINFMYGYDYDYSEYANPLSNGANFYINNQLIKELVIPNEVTTIKNYTFNGCSSLISVTIPSSVTSIGTQAFYDCSSLTHIYCEATTPPHTSSNAIFRTDILVFVPSGTVTAYKNKWGDFYTYIDDESEVTVHVETAGQLATAIVEQDATPALVTKLTVTGTLNNTDFDIIKNDMPCLYNLDLSGISNTTLPNEVFSGKSSLLSIVLPNGLTQIANSAFANSRITSITIPNSVTSIGREAFRGCSNLTSVTIPNSVTSIGIVAFDGCSSVTSISIPNSVTSIGNGAFQNCSSLTSVTWNIKSCQNFSFIDLPPFNRCFAITTFIFGDEVESIPAYLCHDMDKLTEITISNSVTSIGEYTFSGCSSLTSVTIPNSVTSIGNNAFKGCSALTSVTIPNSVTSTGNNAFKDCSSLTSVTWDIKTCRDFDSSNRPFENCPAITTFIFGDEVKSIPAYLCYNMDKLTEITIPNSVTSIGNSTFSNCYRLTSVTIPNSVTSIGNSAFSGCSSLTSVTIPNSVTSIGNEAFNRCSSLTSVTIPNSVTSIGNNAFKGCSALTSVTIPNSVTSTGNNAFKDCSSLTSVTWDIKTCRDFDSSNRPFENCPAITTFIFGDEVKSIPAYLCYNMDKLTEITIPNSVTSIGNSTFSNCYRLTSVTIPNSVTSIGSSTFKNCSSLTSVIWNIKSCQNFDSSNRPFDGCSAITTFTLGDEVESIPAYLCYDMRLTEITIPNSVTSIGNSTFRNCSSLTSITIPNSVISIGDNAFEGCSSLTSVIIPNSMTSIGSSTFKNCSSLTSVIWNIKSCQDFDSSNRPFDGCTAITTFSVGDEVEYIPAYLCYNMDKLMEITMPNSVTGVGDSAFEGCSGLRSITSYATIPPMIAAATFSGVNKSIPVNVPGESLNVYRTGEYWNEFNNYQGLANSNQLVVMLNEGGYLWYNNSIVTSGSILEISNSSNILLQIIPDEGYGIRSITCGGTDYTNEINSNGYLTLPSISSTTILQVTFERLEVHTISYYAEGSSIIFNNKVNNGENFTFYVTAQDDYIITSVTLNGEDITEQLDEEGNIHLSNIQQDIVIIVSTNSTTTQLSSTKPSRLRAWQADGTLFVEVDDAVEAVMVYDVTGRLMQEYQHNGGYQMLNLPAPNKVNLVKVVSKDGSVNTHKLM